MKRNKNELSTRLRFLFCSAMLLSGSVLVELYFFNIAPALASDGPDWVSDPNRLPIGTVTNDNVLIEKSASASSLLLQAERSLKSGNTDRAIELSKRSLELNNDDADTHMIYATALEQKISEQKSDDPKIFNQCIREWLAVLRNKYGEEKNETLAGIGIPGLNGKEFADDGRQIPARQHLIRLTGSAPKLCETNSHYLARVQRQGESRVSGELLKSRNAKGPKAPVD